MTTGGMGHRPVAPTKDEWITPLYIVEALGSFDLDPCAPINPPWKLAETRFAKHNNGLTRNWHGRVWLNPPYGRATGTWLARLADHGNGIALIFARTETSDWHTHIWPKAHAVFFFEGRLTFAHVNGTLSQFNAGAPSALVAYGWENVQALERCGLPGKFVPLKGAWKL